jgi:hypothetical protein
MEFSQPGDPLQLGQEDMLAPGVKGYAIVTEKGLYIPFIAAVVPGEGKVSAFLDTLPKDRRVVFPTVLNSKLQGMLQRRGFTTSLEEGEDIMERLAV